MANEFTVTFPGNKRVNARFGDFEIETDQPAAAGGDGSAPAPYVLFLASLATCAGYYVLAFCQQRDIPTDGISLTQRVERGPAGAVDKVILELGLPDSFPEKYRGAVAKAAAACAVKKTIEAAPEFVINTTIG